MAAEHDDATLICRLKAGDTRALEALYFRHGGALLAFARRMTRDEALAEDVVQDVFVRFWQRPERFDARRGTLRNFLLLQTRGRAVEVIRSSEARRVRETAYQRLQCDSPSDVEMVVERDDERAGVRAAMDVLRDGERAAIELAFFGGLSYCEVAAKLALAEGTVKSRIRRGLARLAPALIEAGRSSR